MSTNDIFKKIELQFYETLRTINLDFDLISELYIDKFNEKIRYLEDKQINNLKLEAKKEDGYILIGTPEDTNSICSISISKDFKIKIENFTMMNTDFENILHNINIINAISNEILEEIKNEILKIKISEKNIKEYMDDTRYVISEKIQIQILDTNTENAEEYKSLDYNIENKLIKITYDNEISYIANFENGSFNNIRVQCNNINHKRLNKIKKYMDVVLKAFEYYLYNKYNKNENEIYREKYSIIRRSECKYYLTEK